MTAAELDSAPGKAGAGAHRIAQRLATRERLLAVCVAEFKSHGYAGTDIAAIVKSADISRGSFYFHFPTKEAVLAELRLREERRIVDEIAPLLARDRPLTALLKAVVSGIVHAESTLGSDLVREMCAAQFRPEVVDADGVDDHPLAGLVVTAVERAAGKTKSRARGRRPGDLAVLFLIGIFGLLSTSNGPSSDRDRLVSELISLTVQGVEGS